VQTILIVDDETDLLHGLERTIKMEIDARIILAGSGQEALQAIKTEPVDLVLTDIRMPEMDGMALLRGIRALDPLITVIIMTAHGTVEKAVSAIKSGAYDFIEKPIDEDRLLHLLRNGLELNHLVRENSRLLQTVCEKAPFENMIGQSPPMLDVFHKIQMLAKSDVTVLIRGETGTGKDLAARALHSLSRRRGLPMVTVNCPAIPESILESELFGYRKGAFTNANEDRKGLFDQADGSTIFLDEIGDLTPAVQTKLLRVLQDKSIMPLGSNESHSVDVRIIAATNRNLEQKIEANEFREDLYYRLNVASLDLPSLSEIHSDIPLLVEHFLSKIACEMDEPPRRLAPEVMNYLQRKEWPGNIRELENTIRGWVAITGEPLITAEDARIQPSKSGGDPDAIDLNIPYKALKDSAIENFTRQYLYRLLKHTKGNVTLSAEISGIKRQSLQKIIKRYAVAVENFRK
jgi:DNA-binding NtrC family response regulator